MKNSLLVSLLLPSILTGASCLAARESLERESVRVEDGDTLLLSINGRDERVQLAYIDAPEDTDNAKLRHDMARTGLPPEILIELGQAATAHLRKLAEDEKGPFRVIYDPDHRDRYGRLVGRVTDAGGRSLETSMVTDGFARSLPPKPEDQRSATLSASEADAVSSARGLWGTHREAALAWRGSTPK